MMAREYEVEHGVQMVPLGVYTQDVDYTNVTVQVCVEGLNKTYQHMVHKLELIYVQLLVG